MTIRPRMSQKEVPLFVRAKQNQFELNNVPFPVNGANNYYAAFQSDHMVERVFDVCRDAGFNVLRTWAFFDTAKPDSWVWFQSGPGQFNDGPNGLERLDRTIALAETRNMRLILPLVNHWDDFGGMSQYAKWLGLAKREDFYTHPGARDAYRRWVEHALLRTNTRTGRQYRDEPAIMAWELANEPRCEIPGGAEILIAWADEMSRFVRSLDGNHLVALGDEGFFRRAHAGRNHPYNGTHGVDCEALMGIGNLDFGVCHLYPTYDNDVPPAEFGSRWIREHIEAARRANKPMLIEEYGVLVNRPETPKPWDHAVESLNERNRVFNQWWAIIEHEKGAGGLLWMVASDSGEPGKRYPDYDGYTVYDASEIPAVVTVSKRATPGA